MKLNEFFAIANGIAPTSVSDEYCTKFGAYDNSGLLVNTGEEVCGALFSLDFSSQALNKAIALGANLIVTHHPAIYGKISGIDVCDFSPLGEKLVKALQHGVSVISMHLNLDCVDGGIDESLMEGVYVSSGKSSGKAGELTCDKTACEDKPRALALMHPVDEAQNCGYGRVYDVQATSLSTLVEAMQKTFSTQRIVYYGKGDKKIVRAASCCGGGGDEAAVEFAVKNGADVLISSDFKHHVLTLAKERNLAVIALTHYAAENYGFEKYYQKIRRQVGIPCEYYTDRDLL